MTRILIHPGEHLADELAALDMSANQLARELGVPTNRLTDIIRGKRGISGDTALRLGRWFGTGPEIWMNLQKNYELKVAAQALGDALNRVPHDDISIALNRHVGGDWGELDAHDHRANESPSCARCPPNRGRQPVHLAHRWRRYRRAPRFGRKQGSQ